MNELCIKKIFIFLDLYKVFLFLYFFKKNKSIVKLCLAKFL